MLQLAAGRTTSPSRCSILPPYLDVLENACRAAHERRAVSDRLAGLRKAIETQPLRTSNHPLSSTTISTARMRCCGSIYLTRATAPMTRPERAVPARGAGVGWSTATGRLGADAHARAPAESAAL